MVRWRGCDESSTDVVAELLLLVLQTTQCYMPLEISIPVFAS